MTRVPPGWSIACMIALPATALAQPVAEQPVIKVGDKWEFPAAESGDGTSSRWSREVGEISSADRLRIRQGGGNAREHDHAMNFVGAARPGFVRTLAKYPLKVGDSWSVGRRWERPDWSEDGSASAVAYEQVSAPARTFSCYPVEGDVSTTNRLYIQRRQSARWHCPEIEWIAKEVAGTRSFNPGNPAANGTLTETPELFKFTPGS